ncbi:MAG: NADH-quinone oxidoreductase subunit NuoN [Pseudomonadota bacterium]
MIAHDLYVALPELFIAVAAMALLMFGVFRGNRATHLVLAAAVATLGIAAVLVVALPRGDETAFNGLFKVDDFGDFMKFLVLVGAAITMGMSRDYMDRVQMARFEFPVLMLLATLGMLLMVSANDLIALYLGLEMQSLALYVIAAFRRDTLRSSEAGLKYFVLGALSSGLLLYGCSMIYGFSGTTSFAGLAEVVKAVHASGEPPSVGLIVGLVFLISGLAFKVSAVPFHMWTPDVYEGAPTPVTAFFANAPKVAAMALLVRILMGPFEEMSGSWQQIIVLVSILSMVLGSFAAINQRNIKRLMAYSSIGHIGFALVGLAAASDVGVRGVALYLAIYLIMNIGTFACILCMRQKGLMVEQIDDLKGLAKTNPMLAFALALLMFSMAGIPPLAGFFGKLYVFMAAIDAQLYMLAVIGVLASVVGAFYYIRIVRLMYFDEPAEAFDRPIERELRLIISLSAVGVCLFIVVLPLVLHQAELAAAVLF